VPKDDESHKDNFKNLAVEGIKQKKYCKEKDVDDIRLSMQENSIREHHRALSLPITVPRSFSDGILLFLR
jgi:hypothetical protein